MLNKLLRVCKKQVGRKPTEFFSLSHFDKDAFFKRWKLFFKIPYLFIKFFTFSILKKISDFSPKKPDNLGGKDIYQKKNDLIRISQQICHLWRFWKNCFFFKKTHLFLQIPEILNIAMCGKFAIIWWWKISRPGFVGSWTLSIGKSVKEETSGLTVLSAWFPSSLWIWAENNNNSFLIVFQWPYTVSVQSSNLLWTSFWIAFSQSV